jgi:hypothetical protein
MRARDNPFRTERVLSVRYRLQGVTWAELLKRSEALRYRAALVGPCGHGKTTLLEDLEPRFREKGFNTHLIRLNEDCPELESGFVKRLNAALTKADLLLLDGADQLRPLAWFWFCWRIRAAGGLIITTHKAGRLPTLWECRSSAFLLSRIAAELLGVCPEALRVQAQLLFAKHRGNLREALRDFYDVWAEKRALLPRESFTHGVGLREMARC